MGWAAGDFVGNVGNAMGSGLISGFPADTSGDVDFCVDFWSRFIEPTCVAEGPSGMGGIDSIDFGGTHAATVGEIDIVVGNSVLGENLGEGFLALGMAGMFVDTDRKGDSRSRAFCLRRLSPMRLPCLFRRSSSFSVLRRR